MSFPGLVNHFILGPSNIPLPGYTIVLFMYLPSEGHIGCFQILAIISKSVLGFHVDMNFQFHGANISSFFFTW